jgi:hypothetical protein
MTLHLPSDTSLLRFNQNAMTLANEYNHTELKKFFADHLGRIHKDSGTLFAPQSSFLDTDPATRPDQVASALESEFSPDQQSTKLLKETLQAKESELESILVSTRFGHEKNMSIAVHVTQM